MNNKGRRRQAKPAAFTGPAWDRYDREFRRDILPPLLDSAFMVSVGETVAPEHIDLRAATEIGLMLLLNKPLLLVVPPGQVVPDALRRAAAVVLDDIEVDSPDGRARLSAAIADLKGAGEEDPS